MIPTSTQDRQMALAEINDEFGAARTNKKEFLEKMDSIIPWIIFVKLVQPHYYKGERGNKPYPLELMLRIFILQNLYDLGQHRINQISKPGDMRNPSAKSRGTEL